MTETNRNWDDNKRNRKYNHYETTKDILDSVHTEDIVSACQTVAKFTCYLVKQHIMPPDVAHAHCSDLMKMCDIYMLMKEGQIKVDDSLPAFHDDVSIKDGHLDTDDIDNIIRRVREKEDEPNIKGKYKIDDRGDDEIGMV